MDIFPQGTSITRKKAVVLHEDPCAGSCAGFKLADWFAVHGYQAILTRRIDDTASSWRDPPGCHCRGCPPLLTATSDTLPRLQSVCPTVPIIAMTHVERPDYQSRAINRFKIMFGAGVFVCEASTEPHDRCMDRLSLAHASGRSVDTNKRGKGGLCSKPSC
jgi:hypothetical protein